MGFFFLFLPQICWPYWAAVKQIFLSLSNRNIRSIYLTFFFPLTKKKKVYVKQKHTYINAESQYTWVYLSVLGRKYRKMIKWKCSSFVVFFVMCVGLNTASLASTTRNKKEARMMSTVTFWEQFSSADGACWIIEYTGTKTLVRYFMSYSMSYSNPNIKTQQHGKIRDRWRALL